jgi:hypothetical protein
MAIKYTKLFHFKALHYLPKLIVCLNVYVPYGNPGLWADFLKGANSTTVSYKASVVKKLQRYE